MSQVLFFTGTRAQFDALETKNADALYFLTDEAKLYRGGTAFSRKTVLVDAFPETGDESNVYVHASTYETRLWDCDAWHTLALPVAKTLNASDAETPTSKAVKTYVDTEIAAQTPHVTYSDKSLSVRTGSAEPVVTALSGLFDDVSYDGATGVLSFTTNGGTPKTVTLPVENFLAAASFDHDTSVLTLTLTDGSTVPVSLADLVDIYSGSDGHAASVAVTDGVISADVHISAETGNILTGKTDGLFAAVEWKTLA